MSAAPAKAPCISCPYRRDVPSGVWSASEYEKLPPYDLDTPNQPMAAFFCHQQDGRICAGWVGCHDAGSLLSLRIAPLTGTMTRNEVEACYDYVSPVPLFGSGVEAAEHGMAEIDAPSERAMRVVEKIVDRRGF